jgi:hypothetical protein
VIERACSLSDQQVYAEGYAMLWDYLKTLIMLRLTLQPPCMCAGCTARSAR